MRPVQNKIVPILLLTIALSAYSFARPRSTQTKWVGTWAASQQIPEPHNALPPEDMRDMTMRQIVHLSVGGSTLRVHVSNAFGTEPLHFTSVHIAKPLSPSSSQIDPGSDRGLTFAGIVDVTVPAGAEYISDPIDYAVAPLSNLAVTFHLDSPPVIETSHPGSRSTSYYTHGDLVSAPDLPDAKHIDHWFQLSGIDVRASANSAAIVVLGDSITDGHGTTTNGNDRWTDVLAQRLQASSATREITVLSLGTGGNHLLTDGLGPNALARFDRDVLAQSGAKYLIVFEGVNDLGGLTRLGEVPAAVHADLVHRIEGAYAQIVMRAHAAGIQVFGATITPFVGSAYYHPPATTNADREAINEWIRAPGHFDAVIDFDKVIRDPQQPDRMLPSYDGGDHLHPSVAGYKAMGEAVPLTLFTAR
ncbi:MAG TPA: SGNH/GDSL hydrolase family protein [Terriglobales bacterium]|nr:SGNH/GDSL hydrolase family protein [Terriglobales bacterium]